MVYVSLKAIQLKILTLWSRVRHCFIVDLAYGLPRWVLNDTDIKPSGFESRPHKLHLDTSYHQTSGPSEAKLLAFKNEILRPGASPIPLPSKRRRKQHSLQFTLEQIHEHLTEHFGKAHNSTDSNQSSQIHYWTFVEPACGC